VFLPCDHCGLPVGAGGHRRALAGAERAFCCLGCSIAFRLAGRGGAGGSEAALHLARIGLGFVLSAMVMLIQAVHYVDPVSAADPLFQRFSPLAQWIATTPVLLFLGVPYLWNAGQALRGGRLGTDLLIALGLFAGYGASTITLLQGRSEPLFFDTVTGLATLIAVGRWLEATAKERATSGLRAFLSGAARPARRLNGDAEEQATGADLQAGDRVRVLPGERLPADGLVVEGRALVDEAALTGEPLPRAVAPGDAVRSPCIPTDGPLVVEVTAAAEGTLLAEIGRVLERARAQRAPVERLADRISAVFVPAIVLLAGAIFALTLRDGGEPGEAMVHALAVLVVACPCALAIATPLAVTAALGRLAERGILVRTGSALAELPRVRIVAFDKTGTLTQGRPEVERIAAQPGFTEPDVLAWAASLEQGSEHALARGVTAAARTRGVALRSAREVHVVPGRGVEGWVAGPDGLEQPVRVGSAAWLGADPAAGQVAIEVAGRRAGSLALSDALRPSAREAVRGLLAMGVEVRILSGDTPEAARAVAVRLGLDPGAAQGGLLPDAKVARVRALSEEARRRGGAAAFVGDGLNDAPALAAADLSIAVGGGTDLAREAAAVTLLGDDLARLPGLLAAARRTRRAAAWNLFWAFGYNAAAVTWAVLGRPAPVLGALAMVLSSLFVIATSARLRAGLPDLFEPDATALPPQPPAPSAPSGAKHPARTPAG
jgi:Cu2+-exporting ATPase